MYANSQFISVRGQNIHYRIVRPGGEPRYRVLLVSSPLLTTACWRYIVPELAGAGCLCVLCDLPGYGLSEHRADTPQDPDTRAMYLWSVLDAIDLAEGDALRCWHLMAHGSACSTIASMALAQPDSVGSLFMIAPVFEPPLSRLMMNRARRPGFERTIEKWYGRNVLNRRQFAKMMAKIYGCPLPERILEQIHRPLLRLAGQEAMLRRMITEGYRANVRELNQLFMPWMVIWGGRDALIKRREERRIRGEWKSAEHHTLPAAGHCPMETSSRAICDYLRGWIRELW